MQVPGKQVDRANNSEDGARGEELVRLLQAGLRSLETQVDELNRINVFPVPDGDTGTNLAQTLRSTIATLVPTPRGSLASVAAAIEENALYAARGNSGVILAAFLRGFCSLLRESDGAATEAFARAFYGGAAAARAVVDKPVEGTMLTVMEETAAAGLETIETTGKLSELLERMTAAAERSLLETPNLLPVLQEAGVFDAGAAGFVAILQGMAAFPDGHQPLQARPIPPRASREGSHGGGRSADYGYCTELMLEGRALDQTEIRSELAELGSSLLVLGSGKLLRIHIHARDPGRVLSTCLKHGSLHSLSIRNMDEQAADRSEALQAAVAAEERGDAVIVAVVDGDGFAEIFRSLGVQVLIAQEGESAEQLADRARRLAGGRVVLLPNQEERLHLLAQLPDGAEQRLWVAKTRSMVEGVAALFEWEPDRDLETNLERMNRTASEVLTVEVIRSGKGYSAVSSGRELGSVGEVARLGPLIAEGCDGSPELCTLYYGSSAEREVREKLAAALRDAFPEVSVEVHSGGQAQPLILISFE